MDLVGVPTNLQVVVVDPLYHHLIFDVLVYCLLSCYLLVRSNYINAFLNLRFHTSLTMNYLEVSFFFFFFLKKVNFPSEGNLCEGLLYKKINCKKTIYTCTYESCLLLLVSKKSSKLYVSSSPISLSYSSSCPEIHGCF